MLAGVQFLRSSLNDSKRFLSLYFRHVQVAVREPHVSILLTARETCFYKL
jgi:hypothetical protein